jgi:hypothetical protein
VIALFSSPGDDDHGVIALFRCSEEADHDVIGLLGFLAISLDGVRPAEGFTPSTESSVSKTANGTYRSVGYGRSEPRRENRDPSLKL